MSSLNPEELRPFGVGESLDVAVNAFRTASWRVVRNAAIVTVPITVLRWFHQISNLDPTAQLIADNRFQNSKSFWESIKIGFSLVTGSVQHQPALSFFLWAFGILLGAGLATRAAVGALVGSEKISPILANPMHWLKQFIRAGVIAACFAPGAVTLILPVLGLWLAGRWLLVPGIVASESEGQSVIERARRLAGSEEFRIGWRFTIGVLMSFMSFGILSFLGIGLFWAGALNVPETFVTASMLLSLCITTGISAFLGCLLAVTYIEQRTRKEGFDIALLIQSLQSPEKATNA